MKATVRPFGESAVLIDWPALIDERSHQEILAVNTAINNTFSEILIETVTSYHSIAVYLKESTSLAQSISQLESFVAKNHSETIIEKRVVTIPVCYEDCFALDIALVGEKHKLTNKEVIALHTAPLYPVYFLGFLPGFPYLGGLDKKLHTSRREKPRLQIAAGSVGIGGSQTGIYPNTSPGGWNIIGKTAINLFDLAITPPNLISAGDTIQFESISLSEFEQIEHDINTGTFQIKITTL